MSTLRINPQTTDENIIVASYTYEEYPEGLEKKVALLQKFKTYLEQDLPNNYKIEHKEESNKEPLIYVKRWLKTKGSSLFRITNQIVQVHLILMV